MMSHDMLGSALACGMMRSLWKVVMSHAGRVQGPCSFRAGLGQSQKQ